MPHGSRIYRGGVPITDLERSVIGTQSLGMRGRWCGRGETSWWPISELINSEMAHQPPTIPGATQWATSRPRYRGRPGTAGDSEV
jgi:hypothetical protein